MAVNLIDSDNIKAKLNGSNLSLDISDSGWINAALTSDFANVSGQEVKYRKIGNIVNIVGEITCTSEMNTLNSDTLTNVFSLLEGYRPTHNIYTICQGAGTNIFLLMINSNGAVVIGKYRNSAEYSNTPPKTTSGLPFNIIYFV